MRLLRRLYSRLTDIRSPDEDTRRRGRTLVTLIALLCVVLLPLIPAPLLIDDSLLSTLLVVGLELFAIGLILVARRGRVDMAAYGLIGVVIVSLCVTAVTSGRPNVEAFFFTIAIMMAGVALRPAGVAAVALLCFGCIAALSLTLGV